MKLKNLFILFILLMSVQVLTGCASEEEEGAAQTDAEKCVSVSEILKPDNTDYKPLAIPDGGNQKGVLTWVVDKVTTILKAASSQMYEAISEDDEYRLIIGMCITLAIMFYVGSIMLGLRQLQPYDGFMFVLKIVLIYNFAVNWNDFQFYVLDTLEAFITDGIKLASQTFSGFDSVSQEDSTTVIQNITIIGEMDKMLSFLWDFGKMKVVMALMLTGATGFFWGVGLFVFMILYLLAALEAIKIFLLALIGRYVLYALGPIFMTFLLFNQTKSLFDGWMRQLISFTLQPIFLFIFLGMFSAVIAGFVNSMFIDTLNNQVSYFSSQSNGPQTEVTVPSEFCIEKVPFQDTPWGTGYWWQLCKRNVGGGDKNCDQSLIAPTIPIDIWIILACVIICYMMYSMTAWIVEVSNALASGAISLGDVKMQGMHQLKQEGKKLIGGAVKKAVGEATRTPTPKPPGQ